MGSTSRARKNRWVEDAGLSLLEMLVAMAVVATVALTAGKALLGRPQQAFVEALDLDFGLRRVSQLADVATTRALEDEYLSLTAAFKTKSANNKSFAACVLSDSRMCRTRDASGNRIAHPFVIPETPGSKSSAGAGVAPQLYES